LTPTLAGHSNSTLLSAPRTTSWWQAFTLA
jgi:hypothetical protein